MSLLRHVILTVAATAIVLLISSCACKSDVVKDEKKDEHATVATDTEKRGESGTSSSEKRTEGKVTITTTTEEEIVLPGPACPGPGCPFAAEHWLAAPTSSPTSTKAADSTGRTSRVRGTVIEHKVTTVVEVREPVVTEKAATSSREIVVTVVATSTTATVTDQHNENKHEVGVDWKLYAAGALVLLFALWLGYKWLPKIPFLQGKP